MIVIITLFYISLSTIIIMVGLKLVSLRKLKVSLVEGIEGEFHGKFYELVSKLWYIARTRYLARARIMALSFFFLVAHEVLRVVGVWGAKLRERHRKWFDMVKGKGVTHKKGAVSFFLRDVAEYKKSLGEK